MNTIQLNLEIDPKNTAVTQALAALILAIGSTQLSNATASIEAVKKAVKETFPAPETASPKPDSIALNAEASQEPEETQQDAEETEETDPTTPPTTSLEDLRELLGKKVGAHRDVIKAELTKLEAKNISVLAPKHYDSFKTFLDNL